MIDTIDEKNIPTLNQVIQTGDQSMQNHYATVPVEHEVEQHDGLNDETENADDVQHFIEPSNEKQEPFIGEVMNQTDDNKNLEIKLDVPSLLENSGVTLDGLEVNIKSKLSAEQFKNSIDFIINDSVQAVMPEIEEKLTKAISQKIYQLIERE